MLFSSLCRASLRVVCSVFSAALLRVFARSAPASSQDNSNIFIGAQTLPLPAGVSNPRSARLNVEKLVALLEGQRIAIARYVAGSVPPSSDAVWTRYASAGYTHTLLQKLASGKEQVRFVSSCLRVCTLRTAHFHRASTKRSCSPSVTRCSTVRCRGGSGW